LETFSPDWASVLFIGILLVTVISRYAMLGERVMSHDETSHVYFSWLLEQGRGYKHDPITHGPLQFHLMALSYFLFGDNDFRLASRMPVAFLTVVFMWNYRRYLGRVGWLVAAFLLLISLMLYYGRYARSEAFVALFAVIGIWAVLRYFDTGASALSILVHRSHSFTFHIQRDCFYLRRPDADFPGPVLPVPDYPNDLGAPGKSPTVCDCPSPGSLVAGRSAGRSGDRRSQCSTSSYASCISRTYAWRRSSAGAAIPPGNPAGRAGWSD
jgi:hypothetical protein